MRGLFAVVDEGRKPSGHYIDPDFLNAYYEDYVGSAEVSNLFVSNFFGELIHTAINSPGSRHDSKLAHVQV